MNQGTWRAVNEVGLEIERMVRFYGTGSTETADRFATLALKIISELPSSELPPAISKLLAKSSRLLASKYRQKQLVSASKYSQALLGYSLKGILETDYTLNKNSTTSPSRTR